MAEGTEPIGGLLRDMVVDLPKLNPTKGATWFQRMGTLKAETQSHLKQVASLTYIARRSLCVPVPCLPKKGPDRFWAALGMDLKSAWIGSQPS